MDSVPGRGSSADKGSSGRLLRRAPLHAATAACSALLTRKKQHSNACLPTPSGTWSAFMTTNRARSASCWATCLDSTALVNCNQQEGGRGDVCEGRCNRARMFCDWAGRQPRRGAPGLGATLCPTAPRRTSAPKDRCVIATSSMRMLNSAARRVSSLRTAVETWKAGRGNNIEKLAGESLGGVLCADAYCHMAEPGILRDTHSPLPRTQPYLVTLRQQLLRLVLRHHGLKHLVADGGQHALVPIQTQILQDEGRESSAMALPAEGSARGTCGLQVQQAGGKDRRADAGLPLWNAAALKIPRPTQPMPTLKVRASRSTSGLDKTRSVMFTIWRSACIHG